jgi:3-oxocholest-4-en-26-oate---CoA ligase
VTKLSIAGLWEALSDELGGALAIVQGPRTLTWAEFDDRAGLRVVATGPAPSGYLNDPERSAQTWPTIDGVRYVVSGDLATVETDGSLRLLGRGSEVVNTGGEKVFVEEVEEVLLGHPAVADALVVGVPDPRFGSQLVAIVQSRPGPVPVADELAGYVGRQLAGHKRPRRVVFADRIERSATGKADRTWARQFAERQLSVPR